RGQVDSPQTFRAAMQHSPHAFYQGYVDAEHIAAFTTCWCLGPGTEVAVGDVRSERVDPDDLASVLDPAGGLITNWNEPLVSGPAGEFVAPEWSSWYQRFQQVPVHSPTSAVAAMNEEATRWSSGEDRWSFRD